MNQKSTKTEVESEKQGEQFFLLCIIVSVQFGIASMVGAKKQDFSTYSKEFIV